MSAHSPAPRNPGPGWGYRFLDAADRRLPRSLLNIGLDLGTSIALILMPAAAAHSRSYLGVILGREVRRADLHRHFRTFLESLMRKLRAARGIRPGFRFADSPESREFEALCQSGEPALFGTFHVGDSDLIGCFLSDFTREIHIVRLRVGNSDDIDGLGSLFGPRVHFIWVNDREGMLFDLKRALESGASLALQCDRLEFGSRREGFRFLGARRWFPFTIYHLAILSERPVAFAFGITPRDGDVTVVHTSPVFRPGEGSRREKLARARVHFQETLDLLERLLRDHPHTWFNFLPLNPVCEP